MPEALEPEVLDVDLPDTLRATRLGKVGVLTLARPAKRNAMTAEMWAALPGVLAGPAADPAVRVLVVTGAGPSFCAGADIAGLLGGPDPQDPMAEVRAHNLAAQAALRAFPKPTVAMIFSRTSSTPVLDAASISSTLTERPSAIATHSSHTPHGSVVGPLTQFIALASSLAVVVLPVPRVPVNR